MPFSIPTISCVVSRSECRGGTRGARADCEGAQEAKEFEKEAGGHAQSGNTFADAEIGVLCEIGVLTLLSACAE